MISISHVHSIFEWTLFVVLLLFDGGKVKLDIKVIFHRRILPLHASPVTQAELIRIILVSQLPKVFSAELPFGLFETLPLIPSDQTVLDVHQARALPLVVGRGLHSQWHREPILIFLLGAAPNIVPGEIELVVFDLLLLHELLVVLLEVYND